MLEFLRILTKILWEYLRAVETGTQPHRAAGKARKAMENTLPEHLLPDAMKNRGG